MVEEDKEKFEKKFPNISKEMSNNDIIIPITSIRYENINKNQDKNQISDELRNPDIIAFIRRSETNKQASEIIDYYLKMDKINEEYANELKLQLTIYGVRSFGSKKEPGYYENKFRKKKRNKDLSEEL